MTPPIDASERVPFPSPEELTVETLGPTSHRSPLLQRGERFVDESRRVLLAVEASEVQGGSREPSGFELAGPRSDLFFDSSATTCAIVSCGGLCPGVNNVIRSLVLILTHLYGVPRVLGYRYGYAGLLGAVRAEAFELTRRAVDVIHEHGGSFLASSRGPQDVSAMADTLVRDGVQVLFTIGGDGTLRGAAALCDEIRRRKLPISVVGIPKTIDNDIMWTQRSFGFSTAVEEAHRAIAAAHAEARGVWNGVSVVKLMGRNSGFIAAHASLASSDVNFCFVPEVDFELEGDDGFLEALKTRLEQRHHAVVVVAEGTGQRWFASSGDVARDASGNPKLHDIGAFLSERIGHYCRENDLDATVRYIDPSYLIRSLPANAQDSEYCLVLGQHAAHAAMAGKTNMVVGYWNDRFTHVPISVATKQSKHLDPKGDIWRCVTEATGQEVGTGG